MATDAISRALIARPEIGEVTGVDPSPVLIDRARGRAAGIANLSFRQGDVSARGRSRRNIGDSADARWQKGSAIAADPGKIGLAEPARYAPAVDEGPPIQHVMAAQRRPFRKEAGRLVPRTITGQVRVR